MNTDTIDVPATIHPRFADEFVTIITDVLSANPKASDDEIIRALNDSAWFQDVTAVELINVLDAERNVAQQVREVSA